MKTLYFVFSEEYGEVEGMFDDKENLLDFWFGNDATWRVDYFEGVMNKIGYTVKRANKQLEKRLLKKLHEQAKKACGQEEEE